MGLLEQVRAIRSDVDKVDLLKTSDIRRCSGNSVVAIIGNIHSDIYKVEALEIFARHLPFSTPVVKYFNVYPLPKKYFFFSQPKKYFFFSPPKNNIFFFSTKNIFSFFCKKKNKK